MPCTKPITAVQHQNGGQLQFPKPEHLYLFNDYRSLQIACGRCADCLLKHARHWAIRCMHEKQMHRYNSFVTLTYNDKHLPPSGSLHHYDFQCFMKRLRAQIHSCSEVTRYETGNSQIARQEGGIPTPGLLYTLVGQTHSILPKPDLKYFMAGEYGEKNLRPHYHALLFGVDFGDRIYQETTKSGHKIYRSPTLEKLWPLGYSSCADVTLESAGYVARYTLKKLPSNKPNNEKQKLNLETGEITTLLPEYATMSRRPGIGSSWFEKYHADIYNTGKLYVGTTRVGPPRYYDKKYLDTWGETDQFAQIKLQRALEARNFFEHGTPERLAVQDQVLQARTKSLKRKL